MHNLNLNLYVARICVYLLLFQDFTIDHLINDLRLIYNYNIVELKKYCTFSDFREFEKEFSQMLLSFH